MADYMDIQTKILFNNIKSSKIYGVIAFGNGLTIEYADKKGFEEDKKKGNIEKFVVYTNLG